VFSQTYREFMEDNLPKSPQGFVLDRPLAEALAEQRQRVRAFLDAHRQKIGSLESRLADQVQEISHDLAGQTSAAGQRIEELDARQQRLDALKEELTSREEAWHQTQQKVRAECQAELDHLDQQRREIGNSQIDLEHQQRALAREQQALKTEQELLARQRELAEKTRESLEAARERVLDDRSETRRQRRRIADEHKSRQVRSEQELAEERTRLERLAAEVESGRDQALAQLRTDCEDLRAQLAEQTERLEEERRKALLSADEARQAESENTKQLEGRLAELERQRLELQQQLAEAQQVAQESAAAAQLAQQQARDLKSQAEQSAADGGVQEAELREELADHKKRLNERASELKELRAQLAQLGEEAESARGEAQSSAQEAQEARDESDLLRLQASKSADDSQALAELESLRHQRDSLQDRLAETEAQLAMAVASGEGVTDADLKKRFEMAVDDVRELKKRNAELEEKLAAARKAPASSTGDSGAMDWESQKKRMLASLESDFDASDGQQKKDKLTVDGAIRITDQVVAERDQEIAELKRLLDEQSGAVGDVAVGAAAIANMLDKDEFIQQERENVKQLQVEWREKLKQAELEMSVERAKIARERNELEEKSRRLQDQIDSMPGSNADGSAKKDKPARGRWLSKLGLKDSDEG